MLWQLLLLLGLLLLGQLLLHDLLLLPHLLLLLPQQLPHLPPHKLLPSGGGFAQHLHVLLRCKRLLGCCWVCWCLGLQWVEV
jgi:hypothetical protein